MAPVRVLLAPDRFGSLTGAEAASALAAGWAEAAPAVDTVQLPQSDGGPGFLAALAVSVGGDLEMLAVDRPERALSVPVLRAGGRTYVEAAEVERAGEALDTEPLGATLRTLLAAGAEHVVVGLGGLRTLDGGRGLVRGLVGSGGDGGSGLAAARELLAGRTVTVAVDTDRTLLGMQGASATAVDTLGLTREAAQESEREMGEWVDVVRRALPPPRDLISGQQQRPDRLPGAGAGGGAGFVLAVLGASLRPGPEVVAEATGLVEAARASGLLVTATTVYDWRVLAHSVAEQVARAATTLAVPGVLLADEVQVGRRETMSLGFSGSYGVLQPGRMRPRGHRFDPAEDEAALRRLAARVAGTWTPARG